MWELNYTKLNRHASEKKTTGRINVNKRMLYLILVNRHNALLNTEFSVCAFKFKWPVIPDCFIESYTPTIIRIMCK